MKGNEFAELAAFTEVARTQNFARAARSLGIVPSTLSQTIRSLEERLGVRLFNRTTRSVALTEAGERLLERVQPALSELSGAVEAVNAFRDTPAGKLSLSISSVPARIIIAPVLTAFLNEYPAIRLEIIVDDEATDLAGRFDAGIRYGQRIAQDMQILPVSPKLRILAFAAPAYIERHGAPQVPQDLQSRNCIRFRLGTEEMLRWQFMRKKERIEVSVNGSLIVNDITLALEAVRSGVGIGYTIESVIQDDIAAGRLLPLLEDWSPPQDGYYLYYSSRRQIPAPLKAFIQFMRQTRAFSAQTE
jgi:DNA-binding transcriptional LysR family regulator